MSMDVYIRLFLYSLLTASARAGPLSTAFPASLTPYLAANIPTCAQPCLQVFIADSFPSSVCSSATLNCLCTSDSETGYTIGEGALSCLVSDCPEWDQAEAVTAYEVCSNVEGATPNTHTIITATHAGIKTVSGSTPTASPTSYPDHHSSIASSSSRRSTASPITSFPSASSTDNGIIATTGYPSLSTAISPSSSIIAAPASASSASPPSPILTKPQIAGVAVASIGAAALAFGLCFLLFCCRRRTQGRRRSVSSFGGDKVVGGSLDSSPDMAIIAARDFGHDPEGKEVVTLHEVKAPPRLSVVTPRTMGDGGWNQWRRNTAPQDIGLAVLSGTPTPTHPSPITPVTPSSRRTHNSQLLPEKPSYSIFPPPHRPSPQSRRASQTIEPQFANRNAAGTKISPTATSNPRFPGTLDTSQAYMQGESSSRGPSSPPTIFPYMQAARAQSGYLPYRKAPTPNPQVGPHWSEPPGVLVRKPESTHASSSTQGIRFGNPIRSQQPSIPRAFPTSPPPIDPKYLGAISTNPPRSKKPDPRPATWLSTGSETSFEEADGDDFQEPVSALTPVNEQHSPIIYPRIPATAAESPTQRSQMSDRSNSPLIRRQREQRAAEKTGGIKPRHSAKWQILQSPVLSEPLATESSSSNSPRAGKGAGMTSPPSGWPTGR